MKQFSDNGVTAAGKHLFHFKAEAIWCFAAILQNQISQCVMRDLRCQLVLCGAILWWFNHGVYGRWARRLAHGTMQQSFPPSSLLALLLGCYRYDSLSSFIPQTAMARWWSEVISILRDYCLVISSRGVSFYHFYMPHNATTTAQRQPPAIESR